MRYVNLLWIFFISTTALADGDTEGDTIAAGKAVYSQTCIACHGANGKGAIPGVADLTDGNGALSKSDEDLIASITEGLQTPGMALAMPALGGNPALTESDVKAVLAYIRAEFGK